MQRSTFHIYEILRDLYFVNRLLPHVLGMGLGDIFIREDEMKDTAVCSQMVLFLNSEGNTY